MRKMITKRSGEQVTFEKKKITDAILKAMDSVGQKSKTKAVKISDTVVGLINGRYYKKGTTPTVEDVQNTVEQQIVLHKLPDVAKSFILYRNLHSRMRNIQNIFDAGAWIDSYINKETWKIHSDSEIDYHLQGMYKKVVEEISERYWMNEVYTKTMRDLHNNKDFHIHKSSAISSYCVGWDLQDILRSGFQGVPSNVSATPPHRLHSTLGQLMNFMYVLTKKFI